MAVMIRRSRSVVSVLLLSIALCLVVNPALAHVTCTPGDDSICKTMLRPGSTCNDQGVCTNPYRAGCLREHLEGFKDVLRTCNSDDDPNDLNLMCRPSEFDYVEIRILAQNWETPILSAWVLQILLSELLNVPTSIETSSPDRKANFYDPNNAFQYSTLGYDYDAFRIAHKIGDCRLTNQSCAQVLLEAWNGQFQTIREMASKEGIIEQPVGSGAVGEFGWFIPRYLAEKDNTLLEYLGIAGEENREKVARTFGRPTRWSEYCQEVSPLNCSIHDEIALRPPITRDEGNSFFVSGLYNGHFRLTEENLYNCSGTLFEDQNVCTGHVTDASCEWSTFVASQAFYHDINVKSSGDFPPNNAYTYSEMTQIYLAANATKSAVLFYWWKPEGLFQRNLGQDSEFMHVQLRPPTQQCVENRVSPGMRCSEDFFDRIGDEVGSCDCEAHSLQKLVVSNLLEMTMAQDEAERSPAYEVVKGLTLSELQLGDMLDNWYSRGIDEGNFDPREAACRWAAENIDFLDLFVPQTYPRTVEERDWALVWKFSLAVSCIAAVLVLITTYLVERYREKAILRFSQISFLNMILVGFILSSAGTCIAAVWDPSTWSCTLGNWLLVLGYHLSIIPLIVKIAAINRLHQAARSCRRLKMSRKRLSLVVGGFVACGVVYLILRAVLDPITGRTQLDLTTRTNDRGQTICEKSLYCDSRSPAWEFVEIVWYSILLLVATVLAFQSRDVRQEFNETHTLAFMIYSRFLFTVLQLMTLFLQSSLSPQLLFGYRTLIRGLDTSVSLIVYFLPKLYQAVTGKSITNRIGNSRLSSGFRLSGLLSGTGKVPDDAVASRSMDPSRVSNTHRLGVSELPRSDHLHNPDPDDDDLNAPLKGGNAATDCDQECSTDAVMQSFRKTILRQ